MSAAGDTMRPGAARLKAAFARAHAAGRGALVTYLMGGDPGPGQAAPYLRAAAEGGADVLEVGIPFSDPVADGPTIQKASVRARAAGTRVQDVLDEVRTLRDEGVTAPIVTMTYANIPYTMGYDAYAAALVEAGVDGTIIPDMPVDECDDLRAALDAKGLANVLLAAPTSQGARLARIASGSRGFLYLVGKLGTTGATDALDTGTLDLLDRVVPVARDHDIPLAVGFGVSRPEHVAALVAHGADGVVVGSALVGLVEEGAPPEAVREAVARLAEGLGRGD